LDSHLGTVCPNTEQHFKSNLTVDGYQTIVNRVKLSACAKNERLHKGRCINSHKDLTIRIYFIYFHTFIKIYKRGYNHYQSHKKGPSESAFDRLSEDP